MKATCFLFFHLGLLLGCGGAGEAGKDGAGPGTDAGPVGPDGASSPAAGEVALLDVRAADLVWPPTGGLVQAWFAAGGAFSWHEEIAAEGGCRLLAFEAGFCNTPCDGVCREGTCVPWPVYGSAGTLAVSGANQPVSLPPPLGGGPYATAGGLPSPFFSGAATLSVTASGGDVPAFDGEVIGPPEVAAPDPVTSAIIDLPGTGDFVFEWDDPDPSSSIVARVMVGGNAHGQPNPFVIECRGADEGSVRLPADLLDGAGPFGFGGSEGRDRSAFSLLRERRTGVPTAAGRIELVAGRLLVYGAQRTAE